MILPLDLVILFQVYNYINFKMPKIMKGIIIIIMDCKKMIRDKTRV